MCSAGQSQFNREHLLEALMRSLISVDSIWLVQSCMRYHMHLSAPQSSYPRKVSFFSSQYGDIVSCCRNNSLHCTPPLSLDTPATSFKRFFIARSFAHNVLQFVKYRSWSVGGAINILFHVFSLVQRANAIFLQSSVNVVTYWLYVCKPNCHESNWQPPVQGQKALKWEGNPSRTP